MRFVITGDAVGEHRPTHSKDAAKADVQSDLAVIVYCVSMWLIFKDVYLIVAGGRMMIRKEWPDIVGDVGYGAGGHHPDGRMADIDWQLLSDRVSSYYSSTVAR